MLTIPDLLLISAHRRRRVALYWQLVMPLSAALAVLAIFSVMWR
jgi:hypothetical protein